MTASDPDHEELAELIRHQREGIAVFRDSAARLRVSGEADGVRAVFACGDALALHEFTVSPHTLGRCSSSELAGIIKTVLADAHQRFNDQFQGLLTDLKSTLGLHISSVHPTVSSSRHVEWSRSGDLLMSFDDRCVVVDVYLAPAVTSTWTAEQLGDRVQDVYTAALLAAAAREGADYCQRSASVAPGKFPSASEVTEFRRRYLDF